MKQPKNGTRKIFPKDNLWEEALMEKDASLKYCPNCGSPVKETHKFCGNCGAPLVSSSAQNVEQKTLISDTDSLAHKTVRREILSKPAKKSPALAGILAFLFGPLGMLYLSGREALICFLISLPVSWILAIFALAISYSCNTSYYNEPPFPTPLFLLFLAIFWGYWGYSRAKKMNKKNFPEQEEGQ